MGHALAKEHECGCCALAEEHRVKNEQKLDPGLYPCSLDADTMIVLSLRCTPTYFVKYRELNRNGKTSMEGGRRKRL